MNQILVSKIDRSHMFQNLHTDKIKSYSKLAKHISKINFYELFCMFYEDKLMTKPRIEIVVSYYLFNSRIKPPNIEAQKIINTIVSKICSTYIVLDLDLDLNIIPYNDLSNCSVQILFKSCISIFSLSNLFKPKSIETDKLIVYFGENTKTIHFPLNLDEIDPGCSNVLIKRLNSSISSISSISDLASNAFEIFNLVDPQAKIILKRSMTIIAPHLSHMFYQKFNKYINLELIDPICFWPFYKIYKNINSIKLNICMLSILNGLSLIDLYFDTDHNILNRSTIILSSEAELFTDPTYIRNLSTTSKIKIENLST